MGSTQRAMVFGGVVAVVLAAAPGCSTQDEGQPPIGSISAEGDKAPITAKPKPPGKK